MSGKYIPLYTKYRPRIFSDITGQESTVRALTNAIESGRIMHAYLFCGPRGTGKTSSARIFAKSLNCEKGPTIVPCGKCPGCLDIINSTPIDVIEIDAASNRSVEDARNILEKVQYAPIHGKYKIYIIDEVHMLTTEASNTLLKTLEEPPENVIFILATTEAHKVLETIVSRCQRYDFRRISTSDIVKRLDFIAKSENIKITDDALITIAKSCEGGMRDAVALLDQLSVLGQNQSISSDDVNEILGQISYDKIYEIVEYINFSNTQQALKVLNEIHNRGNEPSRVVSTLIQYFRDMLILKSVTDKNLILSLTKINEIIFDKIKIQSEKFDVKTIIYFEDRLAYHFERIKENTNKYLWAELCIIDLATSFKVSKVEELEKRITVLESKIFNGEINIIHQNDNAAVNENTDKTKVVDNTNKYKDLKEDIVYQSTSKDNTSKSTSDTGNNQITKNSTQQSQTDDILDIWLKIAGDIKGPAKFFYSKLAKPIEINKNRIIIAFSEEGGAKGANEPSRKTLLHQAACKYFNVEDIEIVIRTGVFQNYSKSDTFSTKKANTTLQNAENLPIASKEYETTHKIENETQNNFEESSQQDEDKTESFNSENIGTDNNLNFPKTNIKETGSDNTAVNIDDISDTAKNILELFSGKITDF